MKYTAASISKKTISIASKVHPNHFDPSSKSQQKDTREAAKKNISSLKDHFYKSTFEDIISMYKTVCDKDSTPEDISSNSQGILRLIRLFQKHELKAPSDYTPRISLSGVILGTRKALAKKSLPTIEYDQLVKVLKLIESPRMYTPSQRQVNPPQNELVTQALSVLNL